MNRTGRIRWWFDLWCNNVLKLLTFGARALLCMRVLPTRYSGRIRWMHQVFHYFQIEFTVFKFMINQRMQSTSILRLIFNSRLLLVFVLHDSTKRCFVCESYMKHQISSPVTIVCKKLGLLLAVSTKFWAQGKMHLFLFFGQRSVERHESTPFGSSFFLLELYIPMFSSSVIARRVRWGCSSRSVCTFTFFCHEQLLTASFFSCCHSMTLYSL